MNLIEPPAMVSLMDHARADAREGKKTGEAFHGASGLMVRYYPVCERWVWFDATGPITKRLAAKLLQNSSI